ncbi:hypothetical protein ABES02_23800 [Neobacillus pocheonensis]|uniref:hypothetical protein n=1 Tax=Neobacillus pocheonensis TaxID=363869 RepID=UPI003D2DADF6
MQKIKQDYLFSTVVSDSTDVNEFIVEFSPSEPSDTEQKKVTRDFDELLEFLIYMDQNE